MSPPLSWSGAPSGTRSFVLVCLDPDADNFVHWVMYDIPTSVSSLPEGVPPQATLPNGATQGARPEDANGDNLVDDADLLLVLFAFGSGC